MLMHDPNPQLVQLFVWASRLLDACRLAVRDRDLYALETQHGKMCGKVSWQPACGRMAQVIGAVTHLSIVLGHHIWHDGSPVAPGIRGLRDLRTSPLLVRQARCSSSQPQIKVSGDAAMSA